MIISTIKTLQRDKLSELSGQTVMPETEAKSKKREINPLSQEFGEDKRVRKGKDHSQKEMAPDFEDVHGDVLASWEYQTLIASGTMTYDLLWTLFDHERKTVIYQNDNAHDRLLQFVALETKQNPRETVIQAKYADWDGSKFMLFDEYIQIPHYGFARNITDLEVYPKDFHRNPKLVEECIKRGAIFEKSCKRDGNFKNFKGVGRVILAGPEDTSMAMEIPKCEMGGGWTPITLYECPNGVLHEDYLRLITPWVKGFTFEEWKEVVLPIVEVEGMNWKNDPLKDVVLEEGVEETITNLVKSHADGKKKPTILLRGPSGMGKRSTVAAFAEQIQAPLYEIKIGGFQDILTVETLRRDFAKAEKYGAVILMCRAELLLEAPSTKGFNDIVRNELVSVFRQVLEHRRCITFLSRSRLKVMDDAFNSAIQQQLLFTKLKVEAREKIWESVLGGRFTTEDIKVLAAHCDKFDGWHIKWIAEKALSKPLKSELGVDQILRIIELQKS
ncbi:hypothetical protein HYFRA_00006782 [Hymenoscyphus fraxineus]|uniref:ATPase AAA-type core domain-containing protein n=1 Tax=Hymenoscyphus fraxineus TaxID=746836 RepID=A0A9N9KMZ6_9HELO|nr:hypothetical protein HYFRA_00006782 [Hymenoscyphus fraxineus]